MRYMRCKCGRIESWTSMGSASCVGCPDCNTTLSESAEYHETPEPHDWHPDWQIDRETGERKYQGRCSRCNKSRSEKEKIDATLADAMAAVKPRIEAEREGENITAEIMDFRLRATTPETE